MASSVLQFRSSPVLILSMFLCCFCSSVVGLGGGKVGGKTEIKDVKTNKEVQKLGKFSVEEFNRRNQKEKPLTFLEVIKAQKQVVAGIKYYFKISAKQNGIEKLFDAVVLLKVPVGPKSKELVSFAPSTN